MYTHRFLTLFLVIVPPILSIYVQTIKAEMDPWVTWVW